jgi:hypothetical protein
LETRGKGIILLSHTEEGKVVEDLENLLNVIVQIDLAQQLL